MNKDFNIGLAALRIWLSFEVVLVHFWNVDEGMPRPILLPFFNTKFLAVPIFMLMSFFLTEKDFSAAPSQEKIFNRFYRLLVPYVSWAIIYYLVLQCLDLLFFKGFVNGIEDLGWQLLLGDNPKLNAQMWYHFDLIIITILFIFIFWIFKKHSFFVICLLGITALFLQYSGLNWAAFEPFEQYRTEIFYLGRICEMIPYACLGALISRYGILEQNKKSWLYSVIVCTYACIFTYFNIVVTPAGFAYSGLRYIILAMLIFAIFYLLPFHKLPDTIKSGIVFISKYSMGIYCVHILIGTILNALILPQTGWQLSTFRECIFIYIISFVISYLIAKLPIKWCKYMVV